MLPDVLEFLPDITLFVAVARAKSFSRAAKALRMPVSTLSRRVSELEAKLGVQLLARSTRQVELTLPGVRYFEQCESIVLAVESAHAELRGTKERAEGLLRISVTQDFALTYMTEIFTELSARFPSLLLELDLTARPVDLIAEGCDVAIRMGALPDSQLFARRVGSGTVGLYAAKSYLKRAGAVRAPADLEKHECLRILGPPDGVTPWSLVRGDEVATVHVRGRVVANSMRFLAELASRGLGIAKIDDAIARRGLAVGALARVLPEWRPPPVPVHALTPSKILPARSRVFLDCLAEHLATAPPTA
jgi:DNA-binding transcriptional LysR family regulator